MNLYLQKEKIRKSAFTPYVIAFILGLLTAFYILPWRFIFGAMPKAPLPFHYDILQDFIIEDYYFHEPLSWSHPFHVSSVETPNGIELGLANGTPIWSFFSKILNHFLGLQIDQSVIPFLGIGFILLPICTVFALRSLGKTTLWTEFAVIIFSLSLPTFWNRAEYHPELAAGQCFVPLAFGFYFHAIKDFKQLKWALLLAFIAPIAFLIHPYLTVFICATSFALPISFFLQFKPLKIAFFYRIIWPSLCAPTGVLLTALTAYHFGYAHANGGGGGGSPYFGMNILGPFWPAHSLFFPSLLPVTGLGSNQVVEGYQWLGFGLLAAILWATYLTFKQKDHFKIFFLENIGLWLIGLGFVFLSIGVRISFYTYNLYEISESYFPFLYHLRSTGRFFWFDTYLFLLVSCFVLSQQGTNPRKTFLILIILTFVQWLDVFPLRQETHQIFYNLSKESAEILTLQKEISGYSRIEVYPRWECGPGSPAIDWDTWNYWMDEVLLGGARANMTSNTTHLSRVPDTLACNKQPETPNFSENLDSKTLLLFTGEQKEKFRDQALLKGYTCRDLGDKTLYLCRQTLKTNF